MKIALQEIQDILPEQSRVTFEGKTKHSLTFRIRTNPSVSAERHDLMKNNLRDLIGAENIMEFYTISTGSELMMYVLVSKTEPMEIILP